MGWPKCNTTEELETLDEEPVWKGMKFHHFGLILSALFGTIAILVSWYLIWRHCTHYLKPWEQKHIVRILFMVPVYAFVSFMSYYFYRHAIYFEVIRDCYEAFAIASFFSLLCHYIAPDLHSQKDYFRGISPRNWVLPINWMQRCTGGQHGLLRIPRSGLTWFNIIWFGVFQYCFIRVFMTCVAVVTQAAGRYCLHSLHPAFAHIWVMVIEGGCVAIAMYCLIQFYVQLKEDLAEHKPLLKVSAIKLVIFLSFWQTILISFLTSSGAVKPSKKFQTPDIKIGIPSMLLCIEMAIFSVFHLWAFPWQVYDIRRSAIVASESAAGFMPDPKTAYQGGKFGENALMDAFNPWDLIKAVGRSFRWVTIGRGKRMDDISYNQSRMGAGLEPTRNQLTAFSDSNNPKPNTYDDHTQSGSTAYLPPKTPKQQGHYRTLSSQGAEEDEARLLAHAQSNPTSHPPPYQPSHSNASSHANSLEYPRPMSRHPPRDAALSPAGDIGTAVPYDPYARSKSPYHQDSSGHLAPSQPYGIASPAGSTPERGSLESQDTGYRSQNGRNPSHGRNASHGRNVSGGSATSVGGSGLRNERSITPSTIPPDPTPLGPPGRPSVEMHGPGGRERGEDERELGGGHGVRENRF